MQPVHLLVVERDADWSQWETLSRSCGTTVVLLIQRADEALHAFIQRIERCMKERRVLQVTVMRAAGAAASGALGLNSGPLRAFVACSNA